MTDTEFAGCFCDPLLEFHYFCPRQCLFYSCEVKICASSFHRFCQKHITFFCRVVDCFSDVKGGEKYCWQHRNICKICPSRTSYTYCQEHQRACSNCSKRSKEKYCLDCKIKKEKQIEQNKLKSLVKERTSITGSIKEAIRFETYWNNNLATVINDNCGYTIWLLVYEPAYKRMGEMLEKFEIVTIKYSLDSAKKKAEWLRNELINHDNPILLIHPNCDCYRSFNSFVTSPYVVKEYLSGRSQTNSGSFSSLFYRSYSCSIPNDYFKPLDIVQVKCLSHAFGGKGTGVEFYHVGIVLSDNEICHFSGKINGARIVSWKEFLEGSMGEVVRYHPVIPFKHYQTIIRQAVWAKDNNFREGQYNLANRNCEHFSKNVY